MSNCTQKRRHRAAIRVRLTHRNGVATVKSRTNPQNGPYYPVVRTDGRVSCTCAWGVCNPGARATDPVLCHHVRRLLAYQRRHGAAGSPCVRCGALDAEYELCADNGMPVLGARICGRCIEAQTDDLRDAAPASARLCRDCGHYLGEAAGVPYCAICGEAKPAPGQAAPATCPFCGDVLMRGFLGCDGYCARCGIERPVQR